MGILYLLWDIITDKGMFVKENLREGECGASPYPKLTFLPLIPFFLPTPIFPIFSSLFFLYPLSLTPTSLSPYPLYPYLPFPILYPLTQLVPISISNLCILLFHIFSIDKRLSIDKTSLHRDKRRQNISSQRQNISYCKILIPLQRSKT